MGILDFLGLGETAGKAIASPIEAVGNVVDKLFTSDEERAAADAVMERLRQHPAELQTELNKIEAAHRSVFVAGWRPSIGWVCSASLAAFFIPQFVLGAVIWVMACVRIMQTIEISAGNILTVLPPYPVDGSDLMALVTAMLGFGTLRTIEKFGGKTK